MIGISAANNLPKDKVKININVIALNVVLIMFIPKSIRFLHLIFSFTPLLISDCRTRLFLAIVQQGTILGGVRALAFVLTVAGTVSDFHALPHLSVLY